MKIIDKDVKKDWPKYWTQGTKRNITGRPSQEEKKRWEDGKLRRQCVLDKYLISWSLELQRGGRYVEHHCGTGVCPSVRFSNSGEYCWSWHSDNHWQHLVCLGWVQWGFLSLSTPLLPETCPCPCQRQLPGPAIIQQSSCSDCRLKRTQLISHLCIYLVLLSFRSYKVISEIMCFYACWLGDVKAHIKQNWSK